MSDGKSIKGHKNVANGFNDFFINVGPNLARKIKGHPEKTFAEFMNNRNSSCMFLKPIIESEVTKVLKL